MCDVVRRSYLLVGRQEHASPPALAGRTFASVTMAASVTCVLKVKDSLLQQLRWLGNSSTNAHQVQEWR